MVHSSDFMLNTRLQQWLSDHGLPEENLDRHLDYSRKLNTVVDKVMIGQGDQVLYRSNEKIASRHETQVILIFKTTKSKRKDKQDE